MHSRLLVIDCAALGWHLLEQKQMTSRAGLSFGKAQGPFPAVTCTAQADFRTGHRPAWHGMIANGRYFPELAKVLFWEQSARLVEGDRFWKAFREAGRTVAMLFWQQSLGEQVDVVLSPAPIHKHHGGMIQDCYSQPPGLYHKLCRKIGSRFKLRNYWGPLASAKVGDWIAAATAAVMEDQGCDLVLTYLPTLDYDLQRYGPQSRKAHEALEKLLRQISLLLEAADSLGYEVLVFGDYAIAPVRSGAAFPNRHLLQSGWMHQRIVQGRSYPDLHT
jgi:predicted AlkP superfamily pyrophosphatase or phosphodiesterase